LTEAERGPHDWEVVAEVGELYEAELMALRLRDAGIETRVIDQSFRQEPLPTVRSFAIVKVYVPEARANEARRLLAEAVEPLEDTSSEGS
jgi:hypothetical protein